MPLILAALRDSVTGIEAAAREAGDLAKAADPDAVHMAKEIVARNLQIDPDILAEVLRSTYGDAMIRATGQAARQVEGGGAKLSASLSSFVRGYDWDSWKPGSPEIAASQLPGIRRQLDSAFKVSEGIAATTKDRIAHAIANGIATGASSYDVGRSIAEITGDRLRADMIAITETNRAYNAASLNTYRDAGISGWIWIAFSEACDKCLAKGGQSFGYQDPTPPAHPDCRCGVVADMKGFRYTGASKPSGSVSPTPARPTPSIPGVTPSVPVQKPAAPVVAPTVIAAPSASPFEPMAGTQVKFKSYAEVRRYFESKGMKVSSNVAEAKKKYNIGLDFFEEVVGGIEDAETKFGGIWDTMKNGTFKMPMATDGTVAFIQYYLTNPSVQNDFGIVANQLGKLWGHGGRKLVEEVMAQSGTASRSVRDTVYHEMEHVWQHKHNDFYVARIDATPKWRPGNNVLGAPVDIPPVIEAMREAGYIDANYEWNLALIREDVSSYACAKAVEFDAELSNILSTPARFDALSDEGKKRVIAYVEAVNRISGRTILKEEGDNGETVSTGCTFGNLAELIDEALHSR